MLFQTTQTHHITKETHVPQANPNRRRPFNRFNRYRTNAQQHRYHICPVWKRIYQRTTPVAAIHLRLLFGRMAACMVFPCHHCQPPAAPTSANRTGASQTPCAMDDDRYCFDRHIHSFPSHTRPDLLVLYLSFYTIYLYRHADIHLGESRHAKPSRYIRQHRPIPYRDFPTVRRAQTLVLDSQKTLTA